MSSNQIRASLTKNQHKMWKTLTVRPHEVPINRAGKKLRPKLEYTVKGLDPNKYYTMALHFESTSDSCFQKQNDEWKILCVGGKHSQPKKVWHGMATRSGEYWNLIPISFEYVELTTDFLTTDNWKVPLYAGQRYMPVLSIYEIPLGSKEPHESKNLVRTCPVRYTEFITVETFKEPIPNRQMKRRLTRGNASAENQRDFIFDMNLVQGLTPEGEYNRNVDPLLNSIPSLSTNGENCTSNPFDPKHFKPDQDSVRVPQLNNSLVPPMLSPNSLPFFPPFLASFLSPPIPMSSNPFLPNPFSMGIPVFPTIPQLVQPTQTIPNVPNPELFSQFLLALIQPPNPNLLLNTFASSLPTNNLLLPTPFLSPFRVSTLSPSSQLPDLPNQKTEQEDQNDNHNERKE